MDPKRVNEYGQVAIDVDAVEGKDANAIEGKEKSKKAESKKNR